MHWYLVQTKPRQEQCALQNLQRQGYECYLPTLRAEKIRQGAVAVVAEPLFPRYLFIRLSQENSAPSWAPIRSTKGVTRLVSFGVEPAKVADSLVQAVRAQEANAQSQPAPLFQPGDRVRLTEAPFAGIEGIYQMAEGERRVMVLIELMSRPVRVPVAPASLRQVG